MLTSLFLSIMRRRDATGDAKVRDADQAPTREVPVFGIAVAVVILANVVATAGMLVSLD